MERPFKKFLRALLDPRGAAAQLARDSGLTPGHISRLLEGEGLPERDTFAKLLKGLTQADRNALTVEYLKEHRPDLAAEVQILVGDPDALKDRLTQACDKLDHPSRESLAVIIEGGLRAPDQLKAMLRSTASIFSMQSEPIFSVTANENLVESPPCSPQTNVQSVISSVTGPTPSLAPDTAPPAPPPIHQLKPSHWQEQTKAAEQPTSPPVTEPRTETTYPRRRKSK